jgi:hypothetical protein
VDILSGREIGAFSTSDHHNANVVPQSTRRATTIQKVVKDLWSFETSAACIISRVNQNPRECALCKVIPPNERRLIKVVPWPTNALI